MSHYPEAITIGLTPAQPFLREIRDETESIENDSNIKPIIIDDIQDVSTIFPALDIKNFMLLAGLLPSSQIKENFIQKFFLAVIGTFGSVFIQNSFLYSLFLLSAIVNFLTSLIWDREVKHREKISVLTADLLLAGFVTILAQITIGSVFQLPGIQISLPIIKLVLNYFLISYVWQITKRLLPMSTFVKSKTATNLVLAARGGWDYFCQEFQKKQEKDLLKASNSRR